MLHCIFYGFGQADSLGLQEVLSRTLPAYCYPSYECTRLHNLVVAWWSIHVECWLVTCLVDGLLIMLNAELINVGTCCYWCCYGEFMIQFFNPRFFFFFSPPTFDIACKVEVQLLFEMVRAPNVVLRASECWAGLTTNVGSVTAPLTCGLSLICWCQGSLSPAQRSTPLVVLTGQHAFSRILTWIYDRTIFECELSGTKRHGSRIMLIA